MQKKEHSLYDKVDFINRNQDNLSVSRGLDLKRWPAKQTGNFFERDERGRKNSKQLSQKVN